MPGSPDPEHLPMPGSPDPEKLPMLGSPDPEKLPMLGSPDPENHPACEPELLLGLAFTSLGEPAGTIRGHLRG
jgi:hypothetical protein